jgi:hypothetical protein
VVVGDQGPGDGLAGVAVVPDGGGQGEDPLGDAGADAGGVRLREIRDGAAGEPLPLAWRIRLGGARPEPVLVQEYRLDYWSGGPGNPRRAGTAYGSRSRPTSSGWSCRGPDAYEFVLSIDGMPVRCVPFRAGQAPD